MVRVLRRPQPASSSTVSRSLTLDDVARLIRDERGGGTQLESRLPIVYSCLTFIAKRLRSVPVRATYADGTEARLPMWIKEPYPGVSYADAVSMAVLSLLHWGNWFLFPLRDRSNRVVAVAYPDPRDVTIDEWAWSRGELRYLYLGQQWEGEVRHVRWFARSGHPWGLGCIDALRVVGEIGEASQDLILRHFKQGAQLQYILTSHQPLGKQSTLDLAAQIRATMNGPENAWRPLIADGFDIKSIQMTAEQAQFLDLAQWTDSKICSQIYQIDPTLLGLQQPGSSLTYTNALDREGNLWRDCLDPIAKVLETTWSELCVEPVSIDLDSSAQLAGGLRDRMAVAKQMAEINRDAGMMVYDGNEIREVSGHLTRPELEFEALMEGEAERRAIADSGYTREVAVDGGISDDDDEEVQL